jgi:hypothetical protein
MGKPEVITFEYREVVEQLLLRQGITEGRWAIYVEFGIGGVNVASTPGGDYAPAAIVPVLKLGIQRTDEATNISVDARELGSAKGRAKPTNRSTKGKRSARRA